MLIALLSVASCSATFDAFGVTTTGDVHRIDSSTATTMLLGNCGFGEVFDLARAEDGGLWTIAGGVTQPSRLISIDPLTGAGTVVATLSLGGSAHGLAFELGGSLAAIVRSNTPGASDALVRIHPSTFSVTNVGSTQLQHVEGLCLAPEGTLYAWDIGSTGGNGLGLVRLLANGAAVDVSAAGGDSDVLALTIDEVGRVSGAGRKLYELDRITGDKSTISSDTGVEFVGLSFDAGMTRLNGALALEPNGTVSRVNLSTGAAANFGSAGATGFGGLTLRQLSNEFWAIRDAGAHSEMWRIDPASGVGTYAFDTPLVSPKALSCGPTGVLSAVDDVALSSFDAVLAINTLLQSTTLLGATIPLGDIEALSIDANFSTIAWDATAGLVSLSFAGQATDIVPAQPSGATLHTLMHDAFGRLFGVSDHLLRVHIPTDTRTQVGTASFPALAGLAPFRASFYPNPANYCSAQLNSAGCLPTLDSLFSVSVASASAGSGFQVRASKLLPNKQGLFFYGVSGRRNSPFLGGTLCVEPPLHRTTLQSTGGVSGCSGALTLDVNARIASGVDPLLVVGATVDMQAWSRDPAVASTTSLSNAIEFGINP